MTNSRLARTPVWLPAAVAAAGATAVGVRVAAQRAEAEHPPQGAFVEGAGVRFHYVRRGDGPTLVLLHGNGAMAEEMLASGLVDRLAERFDVIVSDRPGFGHTERPQDRPWSTAEQARCLHAALQRLGVQGALVVGHSFGTQVALALAAQYRDFVRGLVLLSGYYYPSFRIDLTLLKSLGAPVIGPLTRNTTGPVLGWAFAGAVFAKLFAPNPVTRRFRRGFPTGLALRPSQLRAFGEDNRALNPGARALELRYAGLNVPALVMAGEDDRVVPAEQSRWLASELPDAELRLLPGVGHMIHHVRTDEVAAEIERFADAGERPRGAATADVRERVGSSGGI